MTGHAAFILASYGASFVVLAGLIGWIFMDSSGSGVRPCRSLRSRGVRRRSETKTDTAS